MSGMKPEPELVLTGCFSGCNWPLFSTRLLEAQLQTQTRQHRDELEALHTQIELLKDDIEKKQELLNYTSSLSPEAKVEYSVQQEITRLTNDNLVRNSDLLRIQNRFLCHLPHPEHSVHL